MGELKVTNSTNIKTLRKEKKLTQEELASIIGVTKLTILRWENGERVPKADKAQLLADYFGVTVPYLLGYEKEINSALYETLPTVIQRTDEQYEHYLELYKSAVIEVNNQLDNVVKALNPEKQFSFEKISEFVRALAGEITKLETSSEALLKLKDIQIQNITMKHEFEQFKNYFENKQ